MGVSRILSFVNALIESNSIVIKYGVLSIHKHIFVSQIAETQHKVSCLVLHIQTLAFRVRNTRQYQYACRFYEAQLLERVSGRLHLALLRPIIAQLIASQFGSGSGARDFGAFSDRSSPLLGDHHLRVPGLSSHSDQSTFWAALHHVQVLVIAEG